MTHLICYDITDDKIRKKISDRLIADGLYRVQYSVFIGPFTNSLLERLIQWLEKVIVTEKENTDTIIILPLNELNIEKMRILGEDKIDKEELLGLKLALFL